MNKNVTPGIVEPQVEIWRKGDFKDNISSHFSTKLQTALLKTIDTANNHKFNKYKKTQQKYKHS